MLATTSWMSGSTLQTRSSISVAAQTAPAPTVTATGSVDVFLVPRGIGGSSEYLAATSALAGPSATQTSRAPAATARSDTVPDPGASEAFATTAFSLALTTYMV